MSFAFAIVLAAALADAQSASTIKGLVLDISGAAVPEAEVTVSDGTGQPERITVNGDGTFVLSRGGGVIRVTAVGFAPVEMSVPVATDDTLRVVLQPAVLADAVVVTAARGVDRLPSAASATVLTSAELFNAGAGALDDVLRQTPGFSLFRRSSSRTANPTTQGVTLRGVSGSGASRTLVLADGVPLNDPFGSWVYWNRIPLAAIDRVEIVRGAAGDLYGADALGGVVQLLTFAPTRSRVRATVDGGSHDTARLSVLAGGYRRGWFVTGSGEALKTDGVVTAAPEIAGPVDVRADSDYRTGFVTAGQYRDTWRSFTRFGVYDEDRGNGTPLQVNSTSWRQISAEMGGGDGVSAWEVHGMAGTQDYYQSFTAVAADRRSERLTTEQWTPSDFLSGSGQWSRTFNGAHTVLAGAEARRTESVVDEIRYSVTNVPSGPFRVGGTERNIAVFARASVAAADRVTISGGVRGDFWRSEPDDGALAAKSVTFVSPRVSAAYDTGVVVVQGSVYRAHRTPTLNELHRGFRVGNVVTNPNPLLEPETLTGVEGGALYRREGVSARATAFFNTLDGAIANVTLSSTPTLITRQRQNSDEIRATGLELEADLRPLPTVVVNAQVTFLSSHFRGSVATPALEGNRVPQVPRFQFGAGVTWSDPRYLTASAQLRANGAQFDDDLNTPAFELGSYAVFDISLSREIVRSVQGFFSVENLFDEEYDTARTPFRSIGWPRTLRVGVRVALP